MVTLAEPLPEPPAPGHDETGARMAFARFRRHRGAVIGAVILIVIASLAILAPVITKYDPNETDIVNQFLAPSAQHLLGTDRIGRDLWTRFLYAGQISLAVGISAALMATVLGLLIGLIAGLRGGKTDAFLMRVTDVVLSLPSLIVIAIVAGVIGGGAGVTILFIGLFGWPEAARVVRAVTLSLREEDFVAAARAMGASEWRIIRRHLIFHAIPALTVTGTFAVATAVLTEAGLSYLGIGVQAPQASWGSMLTDAEQISILSGMPWYWLPPGLAIILTVISINLVGDGLRDALDPRS